MVEFESQGLAGATQVDDGGSSKHGGGVLVPRTHQCLGRACSAAGGEGSLFKPGGGRGFGQLNPEVGRVVDTHVFRGARRTRTDRLYIQKGVKCVGFRTIALEVSDHFLVQVTWHLDRVIRFGKGIWKLNPRLMEVMSGSDWVSRGKRPGFSFPCSV